MTSQVERNGDPPRRRRVGVRRRKLTVMTILMKTNLRKRERKPREELKEDMLPLLNYLLSSRIQLEERRCLGMRW